jgi:arsenite-transporting ATPase
VRTARRQRTLLVSTDPASSLGDVLNVSVGSRPRRVGRSGGLYAANLDAARAFEEWVSPRRDLLLTIALRGTYLDEEDLTRLLQLSLPGLDEIVGMLAVMRMASAGNFDAVIVDTAPTGHTLRLLDAPGLMTAVRGRYPADAADAFIAELAHEARALLSLLRDQAMTTVSWVTDAEPMALEETADAIAALTERGIRPRTLIVNRLVVKASTCRWCDARRRFQGRALAPLSRRLPNLELCALPEFIEEPRGLASLAKVAVSLRPLVPVGRPGPPAHRVLGRIAEGPTRSASRLLPSGRWVLFGGKGGVGKSTCAAAYAIDLARADPGRRVLLISTDPAHSLSDVFGSRLDDEPRRAPGGPANLYCREIDAAASHERFRDRYLGAIDAAVGRFGRDLSAPDTQRTVRQMMNLAPPGIDEVMAIAEVADVLENPAARDTTIVTDTAPTGHVLRLLQTPALLREWTHALMAILLKYREIVTPGSLGALLLELSKRLRGLDTLLHDGRQATFVLVTRPALLPRQETVRLSSTLARLNIAVGGVIVNAVGGGDCSLCRSRIRGQTKEVRLLRRALGTRASYAIIEAPASMPPPHGARALAAWASTWRRVE